MNAPLLHPVVPAASVRQEITTSKPCGADAFTELARNCPPPPAFIDLDYWDDHKVATDPRFAIRDGLNARRW